MVGLDMIRFLLLVIAPVRSLFPVKKFGLTCKVLTGQPAQCPIHTGIDNEQLRQLLLAGLDSCLTATQRRRLWLYCVEGWTVRRIADAENVKHPSIVESLAAARGKIKKFLETT